MGFLEAFDSKNLKEKVNYSVSSV